VPSLKLEMRWEKYPPVVGDNDKLPVPFYFELACGLTRAQMRQLDLAVEKVFSVDVKAAFASVSEPDLEKLPKEERRAAFAAWQETTAVAVLEAEIVGVSAALEPWVKMGAEPLNIDGQPIRTLEQYMRAVSQVADQAAMEEPLRALRAANSLGGAQVVFSKRPSGGSTGTRSPGNG